MNDIIFIDSCSARITFPASASSLPATPEVTQGGVLLPAAAMLSRAGHQVRVMGEAGRDPLGNMLVSHLTDSGVAIDSIDRFSDGASTPSTLVFPPADQDEQPRTIHYDSRLTDEWDCVWPRVTANDIVVFGGYFSLCKRVRQGLCEFLSEARNRGALLVYVPDYAPGLMPVVTRIMPFVLENLEMAHAVVTSTGQLIRLFGDCDPRRCYDRKISFYTPLMVVAAPSEGQLTLMQGPVTIERRLADPYRTAELRVACFTDSLRRTGLTADSATRAPLAILEALADGAARQALSSHIQL